MVLDSKYIKQHVPHFDAIDCLASVDSTNTYAATQIQAKHYHYYACFAEQQTQGRGRYNKDWVSPQGNLYASIACQFESIAQLSGLSLSIGVILGQFLATHYQLQNLQLKWPNDLLYQHKKLAGILIDILPDTQHVIIGIGLNIQMDKQHNIEQPWIDLQQIIGQPLDRHYLIIHFLNHFYKQLNLFFAHGFSWFQQQWCKMHVWHNQSVILLDGDKIILRGKCLGVDNKGALLIDTGETVASISNSQFSLRVADDFIS